MTRFLLAASVVVAAAPAGFAQGSLSELCDEFAAMTQQLADLRSDGTASDAAQGIVAGQYEEDQLLHLGMIPQLAAFVYALPEDQVNAEVEASFADQCKAQ